MRAAPLRLITMILLLAPFSSTRAQSFTDIKPSPAQVQWQDLEIGVIIHFSTNTFLNREWGDGTADPSVFNPTHVDTDQWMQAAKSAGAKYAVLVAKHHDGFTLWPSKQTEYSVKKSPWLDGKGDLVRMASDSAHKAGLGFGIYLSPWDRHDPRYPDPIAYDKYYLAQLDELATHYGPLTEFWLDGAGSTGRTYDFDKIIQELRTYQPNTLVFADVALYKNADLRWVGTESGTVPYENWNVIDRAGYLRWRPVEADTPLRKLHWFWHPNDESSLNSVDELLNIYTNTVGRGAQLMLGLAPDNTGRIPDSDVKRLQEFGAAVHRLYEHNLVAESGTRRRQSGGCRNRQRPSHLLVCSTPPRCIGNPLRQARHIRPRRHHGMAQRRTAYPGLQHRSMAGRHLEATRPRPRHRAQKDRPLPLRHNPTRAPESPLDHRVRRNP